MKNTLKKIAACVVAVTSLAVGVGSLNVSAANTTDATFTFEWSNDTSRYDYTGWRLKSDSTYVYMKTVENTLPYNGFYVRTQYRYPGETVAYSASASQYLVNDYVAYVIRPNGTTVSQINKYVRIRGYYSDTTYTWGDATIKWSPDTANQNNYVRLN